MPKNLRKTLYVQDDDYLLSFTKGNFITLTNLGKEDLDHIIRYDLSPLYVSVHSTDDEIREVLFRHPSHKTGMTNLRYLDKHHIETHIQIVLVPGINDGASLLNTLHELQKGFTHIKSIGIVPVGITKYNQEKRLQSVEKDKALETIKICKKFQKKVYLSDEFFLLAGSKMPEYGYYDDFSQIENGIGITADFVQEAYQFFQKKREEIAKRTRKQKKGQKVLIVTSEYASCILSDSFQFLKDFIVQESLGSKIGYEILAVKNEFLGGNVKVAGLLAGKDIMAQLDNKDLYLYDRILLPDILFNDEGLTLDSMKKDYLRKRVQNLKIMHPDGKNLIRGIFDVR